MSFPEDAAAAEQEKRRTEALDRLLKIEERLEANSSRVITTEGAHARVAIEWIRCRLLGLA